MLVTTAVDELVDFFYTQVDNDHRRDPKFPHCCIAFAIHTASPTERGYSNVIRLLVCMSLAMIQQHVKHAMNIGTTAVSVRPAT